MSTNESTPISVSNATASNLTQIGRHLVDGETEEPRIVAIRHLVLSYFDQFATDFEIKEPLDEERPAQRIYTEVARMSEDSDGGEYIDVEDVPEDCMVLQCGAVIEDGGGEIGRIDIEEFRNPSLIDEEGDS